MHTLIHRCQTWSQLAHERDWQALEILNHNTLEDVQQAWQNKGVLASLQWNPIACDVAGNETLVRLAMQFANALGVDALVLPEQTLLGYPLRDMLLRFPKLVKDNEAALLRLAEESSHTRVFVGFAERRYDLAECWGQTWGKPYYNSVAILGDGVIQGVVRKSLLPNYHEFEDSRVFEASETLGVQRWEVPPPNPLPKGEGAGQGDVALEPSPYGRGQGEGFDQFQSHESLDPLDAYGNINIHGCKIAVTVCEDLWAKEPNQHPWYQQNVVDALMQGEPDLLVNLSSSPSRAGKEYRRQALLSDVARHHDVPILYVNQVGAVDELIFDGGSRLVGTDGDVLSRSRLFETQMSLHHVSDAAFHQLENWVVDVEKSQRSSPDDAFEPYDTSDLPRTYAALVCGIRDYFAKCGFKRAVLGLSGGLDSAVNAVLVAEALGAKNVLAFSFPSNLTPADNKSDALKLAENLGIGWVEIPITAMQSAFLGGIHHERSSLESVWGKPSSESFAQDNVQAMSRATLLRLIGNDYHALPIATSDKSEFYMGYATVNGDMSGALAPLGDVCKTKVRALARWMNEHHAVKDVIPQAVVERPSGADLAVNPETGKLLTAEEALMPYEVIDELIWRIEAHGMDAQELKGIVWSWEVKNGVLSAEQKSAWVAKFFKRMQASVFKWWVAPPILIVDGDGTLAKSAYHHVITANKTMY
jgi:NAD+ synthetase